MDPATATLISAGIGLFTSSRMRRDAKRQAAAALKRQQEQQALLDEEIKRYREIQFENPYQGIQNPFEDLTVNQQAAQFQAQQIQQQQANLLQGFRGAISNKELDFVINRNPGLSTSKEGIKLQLALLSRANDISSRYYTEVVAPFVDKNDGLKGTLDGKSFRQLQVEFYQNNPLYTKEIEDKIDSLQGQIDPEYQDNVIVKDGKKFLVLPTIGEVIPLDE